MSSASVLLLVVIVIFLLVNYLWWRDPLRAGLFISANCLVYCLMAGSVSVNIEILPFALLPIEGSISFQLGADGTQRLILTGIALVAVGGFAMLYFFKDKRYRKGVALSDRSVESRRADRLPTGISATQSRIVQPQKSSNDRVDSA
jgi:hypothetical protein